MPVKLPDTEAVALPWTKPDNRTIVAYWYAGYSSVDIVAEFHPLLTLHEVKRVIDPAVAHFQGRRVPVRQVLAW